MCIHIHTYVHTNIIQIYTYTYSERRTSLLINARGVRTSHISLLFFYIPDTCFNLYVIKHTDRPC